MANDISGIIVGLALPLSAIVVSGAAIIVSIILFRIGQKSLKISEQVIISKDIWDDIRPLNNKLHAWISGTPDFNELRLIMNSLRAELGYFVFLSETGVINFPYILYYYSTIRVSDIKENLNEINKTYDIVKEWDESQEIVELIQLMEKESFIFKFRWRRYWPYWVKGFAIGFGKGVGKGVGRDAKAGGQEFKKESMKQWRKDFPQGFWKWAKENAFWK